MQHTGRQTREPAQVGRVVKVAVQGRDAALAQQGDTFGRRGQGQQLSPPAQASRHAQADVPATNDQDTFATEPGGQGPKGRLV